MVDIIVEVQDSASDAFNRIASTLRNAKEAAEEAEDGAQGAAGGLSELASVANATDASMERAESSIDDVNDELQEVFTNSQMASEGMGQFAASTQVGNFANVFGDLDAGIENIMDDESVRNMSLAGFFSDKSTRDAFVDAIGATDDIEEIFTRAAIGDVIEGDTNTLGEFIADIAGQERTSFSGQRAFSALQKTALDEDPAMLRGVARDPGTRTRNVPFPRGTVDDLFDEQGNLIGAGRQRTGFGAAEGLSSAAMASYKKMVDSVEESTEDLEDETESLTVDQLNLAGALGVSNGLLTAFGLSLSNAERDAEELREELNSVSRAASKLAPALSSVSANIGPFNVALTNMVVTLPAIIALVGPLVATLGALATVAIAAVGALGAFAAIGLLGLTSQMEENFAGIENRMQALEAIGKGLAQSLSEAVQPLRDTQIAFGGQQLGPIEFFLRLMRDFVAFVGIAAEILADLVSMPEVGAFFERIEGALLGTSDAAQETVSMGEALGTAVEEVLPAVTDLLVFLIVNAPVAIEFMSKVFSDLEPALREFGASLMSLVVVLTNVGVAVLNTLLPVLSELFDMVSLLVGGTTMLLQRLGPLGSAINATALSTIVLASAFVKLSAAISTFSSIIAPFMETDSIEMGQAKAAEELVKLGSAVMIVVAGLALFAFGASMVADALGEAGIQVGFLADAVMMVVSPIATIVSGFAESVTMLTDFLGITGETYVAVQLLVGVLIMLAGVLVTGAGLWALYTAASNTAIGSMLLSSSVMNSTLIPSITATRAAVLGLVGLLGMLGVGLLTGTIELEDFGAAGQFVKDVLGALGSVVGLSADQLEALAGAAIAGAAAFKLLGIAGVSSLTAIKVALVGTGIGAILVAIGAAIVFVMRNWEELTEVIVSTITGDIGGAMETLINLFNEAGIVGKLVAGVLIASFLPLLAVLKSIKEIIKFINNSWNTVAGPPGELERSFGALVDPNKGFTIKELNGGGGRSGRGGNRTRRAAARNNVYVNVDSGGTEIDARDAKNIGEEVNKQQEENGKKSIYGNYG